MKRASRLLAAAIVAVGLSASLLPATTSASAAPAAAGSTVTTGPALAASDATAQKRVFKPRQRFSREPVKIGARDKGVYDIAHVRELQYRLRWAGTYRGPVTGSFGSRLEGAVTRFQKRNDLRVTGKANADTWRKLIFQTVRNRGDIPRNCKLRNGWHACYDRFFHQVTLWNHGKLWNAWLVRGGSASTQTRTGTFDVYRRSKDHVSGITGGPMPYAQFFDGGQAFHGSATMTDPFVQHSIGCVNMYIEDAKQLWMLTSHRPLKVHVYGSWSRVAPL